MSYAGQPLKRSEDPRLLRGLGSFVDDIKLPGMVHACVVRSPHAHVQIQSVDASAALGMPGVIAVLTGDDLAGAVGDLMPRSTPLLAGVNMPGHPAPAWDKVCYVGQPVAVVVAEDPYLARDALDAVWVSYQPLSALMDPTEAAGEAIGAVLRTRGATRPVYVSIGHKVDLDSAVRWTLACCSRYRVPEPLRVARQAARGA